jgi:hypothetical protein
LRIIERTWYLALTNKCGSSYGVYIPVNALNYVHEKAHIPEGNEIHPYYTLLSFERSIDLQSCDSESLDLLFVGILQHYRKIYKIIKEDQPYNIKFTIAVAFNMIGSYIANTESVSPKVIHEIKIFNDIFQECEYLEESNANKFNDYYGDMDAIAQFKNDFFDITDEERNDALYYDINDDAQNQYLVYLKINHVSEDPDQAVQKRYTEYVSNKKVQIMTHKRLAKRLAQLYKNVKLAKITDSVQKNRNTLSLGNLMWIMTGFNQKLSYGLQLICQSEELKTVINKIENLLNQMYNVFCSHYTIRNSFDTHFVVGLIDKLNNLIMNHDLFDKVQEVYDEYNAGDESFNPFIEIGDNNEESKFALTDLQEEISFIANSKAVEFEKEYDEISNSLNEWLKTSNPALVNLESKNLDIRHQLKYENRFNSSARKTLTRLKTLVKVLKRRHRR